MASYDLLTSTRYDQYLTKLRWNNDNQDPSPFLLLHHHFQRLITAAEKHGWDKAKTSLSYASLKSACERAVSSYDGEELAFKMRVTLSQAGVLTAVASPVHPFKSDPTAACFFKPFNDAPSLYGPALTVFLDTQPSSSAADVLFTSTKTTHRSIYNAARARVGISPQSDPASPDVVLYNEQNLITETSISNVAFYHSELWMTPPLSTGCLPGVLRRWLLQQRRIQEAPEGVLTKESVKEGDWVLMFNSVHGCRLGRIAAVPPPP